MDLAVPAPAASASEVFRAFLRLGVSAVGQPGAQLAAFRRDLVERRGWVARDAFDELIALAQVLPGGVLFQVPLAVGLRQAGVGGALAALFGFALPALAALLLLVHLLPQARFAYGDGWMHGLQVTAAGVLLQALSQLARTTAKGPVRLGMAIGAGVGVTLAGGPVANVVALGAGALIGLLLLDDEPPRQAPAPAGGGCWLPPAVLFGALFVLLPVLAAAFANPGLGLASVGYRAGALTIGSGHVLLPLLEGEMAGRGWIPAEALTAGFGAAQAFPAAPLGFAAFAGAAQEFGPRGVAGGLILAGSAALAALLALCAALPAWGVLRSNRWAQGALAGAAAVGVGLVGAALWSPVLGVAVTRTSDWALVAAAYVFLTLARLPAWLVAVGFALATGLVLT